MKLGLIESSVSLGALAAVVFSFGLGLGACSSASSAGGSLFNGGGDGGGSSSSSGGNGSGSSPTDPPHALGVVELSESHFSGESSSTPYVVASFVPDSTLAATCTTTIAGCTVPMTATCDGVNGHPACTADQTCALDSSCNAACVTPCTAECPTGEECYFETTSSQSCRAVASFNAGVLAFAGTTQSLTLYPPYDFTGTGSGSLFLAGASLEVQGAGSTGAGFAAFDQKFTATTFLQTSPSLSTLASTAVWGTGPIPVGWVPGSDSIVVSLSGPLGVAQCSATDSAGQFSVPRAVVNAVVGTGTPTLTISVTRQHEDWNKSLKTQGTLDAVTVQPLAFLEVATSSTESFEFEGCEGGATMCSDGCVDTTSSATDCGACGHVCPGDQYCSNGSCYGTTAECGSLTSCPDGCENLQTSLSDCGACNNPCPSGDSCIEGVCTPPTTADPCTACQTSAEQGTCASAYQTCENDSNCTGYTGCVEDCAAGDSSCIEACQLEYSAGMSEAESAQTCLCQTTCGSSCSATTYCELSL